ncbi:unnamed protein product [Mesocestoides corti]|uniref:Uncharacterized protein n=1 Tax=Mesocestoides corti TaxID=53468 RepID=A0A0R3U2P4_MESCO|nr:unnamed protein product [Mesocestoides corti]
MSSHLGDGPMGTRVGRTSPSTEGIKAFSLFGCAHETNRHGHLCTLCPLRRKPGRAPTLALAPFIFLLRFLYAPLIATPWRPTKLLKASVAFSPLDELNMQSIAAVLRRLPLSAEAGGQTGRSCCVCLACRRQASSLVCVLPLTGGKEEQEEAAGGENAGTTTRTLARYSFSFPTSTLWSQRVR